MTRFLRDLTCLIGRHEPIWAGSGMTCYHCGTVIDVLPQPTVRGPAHTQAEVRGTPIFKKSTIRKDNVTSINRSA